MPHNVSFGSNSDVVAFDDEDAVGDEDHGCLHRKRDLFGYGMMDNSVCDPTAEVSRQKDQQPFKQKCLHLQ